MGCQAHEVFMASPLLHPGEQDLPVRNPYPRPILRPPTEHFAHGGVCQISQGLRPLPVWSSYYGLSLQIEGLTGNCSPVEPFAGGHSLLRGRHVRRLLAEWHLTSKPPPTLGAESF